MSSPDLSPGTNLEVHDAILTEKGLFVKPFV